MTPAALRDGLLLAIGTFTAFRVPPPRTVDRSVARVAVLLAGLPGLLLGLGAAAVLGVVGLTALPPFVGGLLAVGWLLLATRAFHADGLADTVDGLTSGYDPAKVLAVMRGGDVGPAGAAALVVVLALDAACLGTLGARGQWVAVVLAITVSRAMLAVACRHGVTAARPEGLGALVADLVPVPAAIGVVAVLATLGLVAGIAGPVAVVAAALVALEVSRRGIARVGGTTGDLLGATVELCCCAALLVLAA